MESEQSCFQPVLSNKVHALEKSFSSSKTFSSPIVVPVEDTVLVTVKLLKGFGSAVQILHILTFCVHKHTVF